jgi:2'-5' RNA ligase
VRLFVSLDVPRAALDHLDRAVEPVRHQHADVRWIPVTRWHVTVAFLGDVDESALERLDERLARAAARHAPTTLAFVGAGRFGSRVLWAGVAGDREELRGLARSVAAASRRAGVAVEERVHRPHLTLARSRTSSLDLRPLVDALSSYEGPTWPCAQIHLVRSHLGPAPRYDVLRSWPLDG